MARSQETTINDIIGLLDDNIQVSITAYNIPLYQGLVSNIPAIYCIYPITEKLEIHYGVLQIVLDC